MNAAINKSIVDFINDFNLLDGESVMHFNAKILYLLQSVPHQYQCEVPIIPIKPKNLDAIYLLNSEIKQDGFDEMFTIKNEHIKYEKRKYLLIQREDKPNVYIFPANSRSNPEEMIKKIVSLV